MTDTLIRKFELAGKTQYRTATFDRSKLDVENRTCPIAFSSETPVERGYGNEILDHSPGCVRCERLNSGSANVLFNHDPDQLLGVIPAGTVQIGADRVGRCVVRFGRGAFADEKFRDVQDGILSSVSVGYQIHDIVLDETKDGQDTYRATDWEPYEVSMVTVPADASVGVGRSKEPDKQDVEPKETPIQSKGATRKMKCTICGTEHETGTCPACAAAETRFKADYEQRMKDTLALHANIRTLAADHKCPELAEKGIKEGWDLQRFQHELLTQRYSAKAVDVDTRGGSALVGMNDKEIKRYSLVRAINALADGKPLDGLEREASDAVAKIAKRAPGGFYLPQDIMGRGAIALKQRALDVVPSSSGGYAIGTQTLGSEMIELLRNATKVAQMGARTLTGLVGNIVIPKVTGGATAYWLGPSNTVTESDQSFGQLALAPHRLVGDTAYGKELLMQASIDVEAYVREDLMRILAIAKDLAAIDGKGSAGEPLGITNTTGINTVTFSAAASWGYIVQMETKVATANALIDGANCAYLTTPATRGKWKTNPKIPSSTVPMFLWDTGANGAGIVNGYRAEVTNQVPSDKVIFGQWSDLILADWAGIDIVVDPYSLKKTGQVEITITLWTDCGIRHPLSFTVSTDSGAQ
jgi:HK97 family phage major capsid protein/HK97 family phage prohead protease